MERIKQRARSRMTYAIKKGVLVRPTHCEDCKRPYKGLHGHHEDYTKPLDVEWLCPPCHSKRTIERGEMMVKSVEIKLTYTNHNYCRWEDNPSRLINDLLDKHYRKMARLSNKHITSAVVDAYHADPFEKARLKLYLLSKT